MIKQNSQTSSADRLFIFTGVFAGAVTLYTAGGLFWVFLPYFIGLQTESGGLTQAQAGFVGSGYLLGFTVASVTALWWVPRFNMRVTVTVAAALIIIGFYILQDTQSYTISLLSVILIGIMKGSFWVIAYRIFASTSDPDRSFATGFVVSYSALAALSYFMGKYIVPNSGLTGAALLLSGLVLVLALGALFIPTRLSDGNSNDNISYRPPGPVVLALIGIMATGVTLATVWAFAERIGVGAGFSREAISPVIASNLLAIAAGSVFATILGTKFKRRPSLYAGLTVMAAGIFALSGTGTFWLYAAGIFGLGLGLGFAMPYQLATLAVLDKEGRFVVLIVAAQQLGTTFGPFLGGWIADIAGIQGLVNMAILILVLSGTAFFLIPADNNET